MPPASILVSFFLVMMRRLFILVIVVGTVFTGVSGTAVADTEPYPYDGPIPERTGVEYNQLFTESLERLPGLRSVSSSRLYIFGTSRDDLIYQVQFSRGYQLRPEADPTRLVGTGTSAMQPEMAEAWAALRAAAARRGWSLSVRSAFRSVDTQRSIARREYRYADTWSEIDSVARWHSVPGTSKHHTGYTLDIGYAGRKLYSYDAPYKWLSANNYAVAKSFGFIPSYPPDGGKQGPNPEPWEWNWVGIDNLTCAHTPGGCPEQPVGRVERVEALEDDRVRVVGWTFDSNVAEVSIPVHVYVDGVFTGAARADRPRADVNRHFGILGDHGYNATFDVPVGFRQVCVYAINDGRLGSGPNPKLGCVLVNG